MPHLKQVLTRALPILASIKQDNMRWVFAAGIGRWAEALVKCLDEQKKMEEEKENEDDDDKKSKEKDPVCYFFIYQNEILSQSFSLTFFRN